MKVDRIAVERFKVLSSRPFDSVVAALKSAVGQPDWNQFVRASQAATSASDFERVVQRGLGRTGFMLFAEFDLGAVLQRESGSDAPKSVRFLVGNPLIMK
jgi:hypothetical protein